MFTPPNMLHVTCHMSRVTCHVSRVTCHVSHVTCQKKKIYILIKKKLFFFYLKKMDKVVELVGGGSVINGAYPVQFYVTYQFNSVTFSKHRPSGPMLSISRNVRLSVCPSVCVFTFEVPFKRLFAPTSRSWMSNIFRDSEFLGKSNGKKWSQIGTFLFENCQKSPRKKKFFLLISPYKTWWKPRFPMDQRPLDEGRIANFGISLDGFEFLRFR